MNPFLFIVGSPRSGTTLLQRIVNAHSQIAVIHETHWISRWYEKRAGLTPEGNVRTKLIDKLLAHPRFFKMKISREQLETLAADGAPVHYARFVTGMFDLYGRRKRKPLVGDKTPGYVRDVPTLHQLWPAAKFVHLIRDGRDTLLSFLDWDKADDDARRFRTWEQDRMTTLALWWEWHVRLGLDAGEVLGTELYYEMRYESLVADPAKEVEALCAFLGVPFEETMLRFHEGRCKDQAGLSAKNAWLPVTSGLRNWRTQMMPADLDRFEAVAGELLEELGYPRAVPHPSGDLIQHAGQLRRIFSEDVQSRRRVVPELWRISNAVA